MDYQTLSAAAINALRRDALTRLTALRARRDTPVLRRPQKTVNYSGPKDAPAPVVQVTTKEPQPIIQPKANAHTLAGFKLLLKC